MKSALLLVALSALSAVKAVNNDNLVGLGYFSQQALLGSCLALQEDWTDVSSDCYLQCTKTGLSVYDIFDTSTYNGNEWNTGDFVTKTNIVRIQLMSQFTKCAYTSFFLMIDNRLSSLPFVIGMVFNIGV